MQLTYAFCDDWLIYARAADGSWWSTITETWPEWLDAARDAGIDPDDWEAVDDLATAPRAVEHAHGSARHRMGLRPVADRQRGVRPDRRRAFATWTRVPDSQTADLEAFAARRR